jgi:hypothetical protein
MVRLAFLASVIAICAVLFPFDSKNHADQNHGRDRRDDEQNLSLLTNLGDAFFDTLALLVALRVSLRFFFFARLAFGRFMRGHMRVCLEKIFRGRAREALVDLHGTCRSLECARDVNLVAARGDRALDCGSHRAKIRVVGRRRTVLFLRLRENPFCEGANVDHVSNDSFNLPIAKV